MAIRLINRTIHRITQIRGKLERSWVRIRFDGSIYAHSKKSHDLVIAEAELSLENKHSHESDEAYAASRDPLTQQGHTLKKQAELRFKDSHRGSNTERIIIHVPDPIASPAGYSLFINLAESLNFIGVPTAILGWHDSIGNELDKFKPTVLLSSDHVNYLARIDWDTVRKYRETNSLRIGLTASLAEYGNTPLGDRLDWARKHGIDFYFSFRDETYVNSREEYRQFFAAGYRILYLPFGANILHYYPVAGFERDIDYVLIASRKREHMIFMKDIVKKNFGFIDGPGWKHATHFKFNRDRDRYIYARAKTGLNVHLPEQISWACEVNERTFQLAACGVPQIIDHPKILDRLFSKDALFIADTPGQYYELFKRIMNNPALGQERALIAQQEAFEKHTTFHRAVSFMQQLRALRLRGE